MAIHFEKLQLLCHCQQNFNHYTGILIGIQKCPSTHTVLVWFFTFFILVHIFAKTKWCATTMKAGVLGVESYCYVSMEAFISVQNVSLLYKQCNVDC